MDACMHAKSLSCVWLCDAMDHSPLGSAVLGILQVWILECVTMPSSRGSSWPRDQTCMYCLLPWQEASLPLVPPEKPKQIDTAVLFRGFQSLKNITSKCHSRTFWVVKMKFCSTNHILSSYFSARLKFVMW